MKKLVAIFLACFLILGITACSSNTTTTDDTMDSEDLLVGEWEATQAPYADDVIADIVLTLDKDGDFEQEVFYVDKEGNVENTEEPNEKLSGTYTTNDDKIKFTVDEITKDGTTTTGEDVAKVLDQDGVDIQYSYEVVDDTLTINTTGSRIWDFVKLS